MAMRPKRKVFFLVLAICITFSIIFTETLTASILDHDCIGEQNGCPFCLLIRMAKNLLNALQLAGLIVFLIVCFTPPPAQTTKKHIRFIPSPNSPIALKVRFNI